MRSSTQNGLTIIITDYDMVPRPLCCIVKLVLIRIVVDMIPPYERFNPQHCSSASITLQSSRHDSTIRTLQSTTLLICINQLTRQICSPKSLHTCPKGIHHIEEVRRAKSKLEGE